MQGDIYTAMADLTPEAMGEAMALATGLTTVPTPQGYEIESHEEAAGAHSYRVLFKTSAQDFRASVTWRQVAGAWKIASLRVQDL